MSHKLISLNTDLKKLRDEGYEVNIVNDHLVVTSIPYVKSNKEIAFGFFVCPLNFVGEKLSSPPDHTVHFAGDHPCDKNGSPLTGVVNSPQKKIITGDISVDYYLSAKPPSGKYEDFYEKITTYVKIFEVHAKSINPKVSSKTFKAIKINEPSSIFNYCDTNSSRAGIQMVSAKLEKLKIAIIGLGGTGSYILDYVSKTPVEEIHLFDGDEFLLHNAFRSPGAPTEEELNGGLKKVDYFSDIYSKMRKNIFSHSYYIEESNLDELAGMDFVFICIDRSEGKKKIFEKLINLDIPFIDVGTGVNEIDNSLIGTVRSTTVNSENNSHIEKRISFSDVVNNDYDQNIQIAELNALNASFAVIKWKKMLGFYHEQGNEYNVLYEISTNKLHNNEHKT